MNRLHGTRWRIAIAAALVAGLFGVIASSPANATQSISSATGPLTNVTTTDDLNCAVNHVGDAAPEFYGTTACATLVAIGDTLYGPANIPAGGSASPRTPFTPVSQTGVTGSGTAADPYKVVTVVNAGSAAQVTQTDTYEVGKEFYRTDVKVTNLGATPVDAIVYRAGDCFLQNSDVGFGLRTSATAIACRGVDETGTQPGPRIEEWVPVTAGSHFYESGYNTVWARIGAQQEFPDTCDCDSRIDNGAGLSWKVTVAGAGSTTVSHLLNFSPAGDSATDPPAAGAAPVFVAPTPTSTLTAYYDSPLPISIKATDADTADHVNISITGAGVNPSSITGTSNTTTLNTVFRATNVGLFTLVAHATDGTHTTDRTITINVLRRPTKLTAYPAVASIPRAPKILNLTVSAKLIAWGWPVPGRVVTFYGPDLYTELCQATTDVNGFASCQAITTAVQALLNFGYTAKFGGDTLYEPSTSDGNVLYVLGLPLP